MTSVRSQELIDSHDEQTHKKALIDAAAQRLAHDPALQGFARLLFAKGPAEDLLAYNADDLARFARHSFEHVCQRVPGTAAVRVVGCPENRVTIVEVLNDNMPFLLDSVMGALNEFGQDMRLVLHPIIRVSRDSAGRLRQLLPDTGPDGLRESLIHIHIDEIDAPAATALAEELNAILNDVRLAVADWRTMLARLDQVITQLKQTPPPMPAGELDEGLAFLDWLRDNNFTFLGMREYKVSGAGAQTQLQPIDSSGLGLLRTPGVGLLRRGTQPVTMTPELLAFLSEPRPLIISKSNTRSRVHRRVHIDYIGIKLFDSAGALTGELRIAGLFTSTAYTRSVRAIPLLRRKVDGVLLHAGYDADSHSGKALINIVEHYPRDELFQIEGDLLNDFAERLLQLEERPRVRVLVRPDRFNRFVSLLVYVPRDGYTSVLGGKIGQALAEAYDGRAAAMTVDYPEGLLARLHFIVARNETTDRNPPRADLEKMVGTLVRSWKDAFAEALCGVHGNAQSKALLRRYSQSFPPAYQDAYTAHEAVRDIAILDVLNDKNTLAIDFYTTTEMEPNELGLKLFHWGEPLPLSRRVPILEAMGFSVVAETSVDLAVNPPSGDLVVLHDMRLHTAQPHDFQAADARLEDAFLAVWNGLAENDGYNTLVLSAGLPWREVAVVRALSAYLRQVGIPYAQDYMSATLVKHSTVARHIITLFHQRFDACLQGDSAKSAAAQDAIAATIEAALVSITSLDEDTILRRFLNLVQAMLRTNFYQRGDDGALKATLSFKFDSQTVDGLPAPRPFVEIFVASPRVEGVHLRFGRIARGGLRWSDRRHDFRTEVLGLVKAQQVKNAVIVPVGAKGGFVPKQLPEGPRDAVQAEGIAAYTLFVTALLDLTDNISADGHIIRRPQLICYDGEDPYLVVAADKGTATFSDTANAIAAKMNHWLGDAFASGGSAGYDHKKMGITARGAWEAVKRHFREMDRDIQTEAFTVAGVGDMSGDVFGNGMLLSKATRLIAAFDHRDIFIDPDPDPALSFAERQRLFALPRSSWADYNAQLISKGGGVFARSAKSIPLTPQLQDVLGLSAKEATPRDVMSAILKMPVDLLWFGGIGTYVRASAETDDQAGDRTNDTLRITAAELRAKVIGEGANLGMTQRARCEAALLGVRLNTDAIDNSAGVNSSDMEVNIKIALGPAVATGRLDTAARNALLESMTEDVARFILRNNYLQTFSLSLSQRRGAEDAGFAERLMQLLESEGRLNRKLEYLPDTHEMEVRQKRGEGLTRPELAVLLAYAKLSLHDALLASPLVSDEYFCGLLQSYFPPALAKDFANEIRNHRLAREIVATSLSNALINFGGAAVLPRLMDQTGAGAVDIATAYALTSRAFDLPALFAAIDALDGQVSGAVQLQLYRDVQDVLHDRIVWFLRHPSGESLTATAARYNATIRLLAKTLSAVLPDRELVRCATREEKLKHNRVPDKLAASLAGLPLLIDATDIQLIHHTTMADVAVTARAYYELGDQFALADIYAAAKLVPAHNYYDRLALDRAVADLSGANRQLSAQALQAGGVDAWIKQRGTAFTRTRDALCTIALGGDLTVSKLSVAAGQLSDLAVV